MAIAFAAYMLASFPSYLTNSSAEKGSCFAICVVRRKIRRRICAAILVRYCLKFSNIGNRKAVVKWIKRESLNLIMD